MDQNVTRKPPVVMLANAGHKPLDTRIFHKEAKSLQKAGYEVTLIIPHDRSFEQEGIKVEHVALPTKGWHQLLRCPLHIWRRARQHPSAAIFHLHDSELLLVGLVLRMTGRRVIYDAHEDTPLQISYQHWIPWLLKKPYAWFYFLLEKLAGWCFHAVIVAEPVIARYFPVKKVTLIRNFPIAGSFKTPRPYLDREKTVVYVGLLSKPRGVVEMLTGFRMAHEKTGLGFVLGGKFAPAALEVELLPCPGVAYRSWLPYGDMIEALETARIGIITPHPIRRYLTNYPVKLFEYMAAGLPVIAARDAESSTFITEADAGILVNPLDTKAIADAMVTLCNDTHRADAMGQRGRALIMEKYNWEKESAKLLQLYEELDHAS